MIFYATWEIIFMLFIVIGVWEVTEYQLKKHNKFSTFSVAICSLSLPFIISGILIYIVDISDYQVYSNQLLKDNPIAYIILIIVIMFIMAKIIIPVSNKYQKKHLPKNSQQDKEENDE